MKKFIVQYDGEWLGDHDTQAEAVARVKEDYDNYLEDKAAFPQYYGEEDSFYFEGYSILQEVSIDLEKIITTSKSDSIPKSHRGEGVNYVD